MYDNGYIVKCRSILTNDICLSEASHKADVFLVCISYLTYSLKKCINNLAVWKIRVNTHTHTHTHTAHRPSTALASRRSAAFRVSTPSKNMALPLLGVRPFALRAVCRKPHPSPLQHEEATYDA